MFVGVESTQRFDSLMPRDFLHDDSKEVAGAFAIGGNLRFDLSRVEPGNIKRLAGEPLSHGRFPIARHSQVAIDRLEHIEHIHLCVELCETTSGKKQMIEKTRARTRTAYDKYGSVAVDCRRCLRVRTHRR